VVIGKLRRIIIALARTGLGADEAPQPGPTLAPETCGRLSLTGATILYEMALLDLFSRRQKKPPSTVSYDDVPAALRSQAIMILAESVPSGYGQSALDDLGRAILREHPTPSFALKPASFIAGSAPPLLFQYIASGSTEECLDGIEVGFRFVNTALRSEASRYHASGWFMQNGTKQMPGDAVDELNGRFRQHGLGYAFSVDGNQLIRADSQFINAEVVQPAWTIMHELGFDGPADEFAHAHECYRRGDAKDAVTGAVRALESTAKAICDARRWKYDRQRATAVPLLKILFEKGLIPSELDSHFAGLRVALESGLPTIGNRHARHGQGAKRTRMEDQLVALALHQCAAAILFLCQAHRDA
jgi:hypothetical protein